MLYQCYINTTPRGIVSWPDGSSMLLKLCLLAQHMLTPTAANEFPTRRVRLACLGLQLSLQTNIAGTTA